MRHREFISENMPAVAVACGEHLDTLYGEELQNIPKAQREQVLSAVFGEMHDWAVNHNPVGAPSHVSERFIRKGLEAAKNKVQHNPPAGIDPLTVLTIISILYRVVSWLVRWFQGGET